MTDSLTNDKAFRENLCQRAFTYAKDRARGPGIVHKMIMVAYDDNHLIYMGDGRYVIGYLAMRWGSARWPIDANHYPILWNPSTQRLQVQLPPDCIRQDGSIQQPRDTGFWYGIFRERKE